MARHRSPRPAPLRSQRRPNGRCRGSHSQRILRVERLERRTLLAADVYVDDDWVGTSAGADPDAAGPAEEFGVDAFATIGDALAAVDPGGTVHIFDGAYAEVLSVTQNVALLAETPGGVDLDAGGAATAIMVDVGAVATVSGFDVTGFTGVGVDVQGEAHLDGGSLTGTGGVGVQVADGATATIDTTVFDGLDIAIDVAGAATLTANTFGGTTTNSVDLRLASTATSITVDGANAFTATNYYIENLSGLGLDLTGAPATLFLETDSFRIEDRIYHALDDGASGLVRVTAGELFVTAPATGVADETIQRAIDAATIGDTINVESGAYAETLSITQDVTLLADTPGGVDLDAGGAATAITVDVGAVATVSGFDVTGFTGVGIDVQGEANLDGGSLTGTGGIGVQVTDGATATIDTTALDGLDVGVDVAGAATLTANAFGGTTTNLVDVRLASTATSIAVDGANTLTATDYYIENLSGLGLDLTGAPATLFSETDGFRIEDRIYHALDDGASGLVRVTAGELFVTAGGTGASDETIQRALDAADIGDTINVESGSYAEVLSITQDVTLLAETPGGVDLDAGGAATAITVDVGALATVSGFDVAGFTVVGVDVQGEANLDGGSLAGTGGIGVQVADGATATIDTTALDGFDVGVDVAGAATLTANAFGGTTTNLVDLRLASTATSITVDGANTFTAADYYIENLSGLGLDLTGAPATLFLETDSFRIEDRIYHALDDGASGLVRVTASELFVTAPATGVADETIQRAIDAASAGDTINVESGAYAETLLISQDVTLLADTPGGVDLDAGGAATAITIDVGAVATVSGFDVTGFTNVGIDVQGEADLDGGSLTGTGGIGVQVADGATAEIEGVAFDGFDVGVDVAGAATLTANAFGATTANLVDLRLASTATSITVDGANTFTATDYYIENLSGLALDLTGAPSTLFSETDGFRIEDRIYHALDDGSSGLVRVTAGELFVTASGTGPSDETIQRALDAADIGDTINVESGSYAEVLSITQDVTLLAETPGGVDLDAGGAATAITVDVGAVATVSGFDVAGFTVVGVDVQGEANLDGGSLSGTGGVGVQVADGATATIETTLFDGFDVGVDVAGAATLTANAFGGTTTNLVDLRLASTATSIAVDGTNTLTATDYYIENLSSLGLDLTGAPTTLFSETDGFRIEDRIYHALDDGASGLVRVTAGELFVTTPATGAADETIQRTLDAADIGDTINVEAGVFVEDLSITTADVELVGAGAGVTTIEGVATNAQTSFPLATPNINVLASGVSIHGFTILSPDVAAGDYSSGILIDSPDIEIYDNEFVSRQGDAAPTGANDSLTNVAIQTWAGSNSGKASNVDGLSVHDNTFTGNGKGYYGLFVNPQAEPVVDAISIADNQFTGNIWRAIEVERSSATISGNQITPGVETLQAWGGSGISVRNFTGDPIADVVLSGNTITGADGSLGQGFAAGVLVGFGTQAIDLSIDSTNTISDHAIGVRINAGDVQLNDAQLTGNGTGVLVGSGATATLLGDSSAISGGDVGLDVDGGVALAEGYAFDNNTIGVRVQNGGLADLGQAGVGVDFTSLGVSAGGNDFTSFVDPATSSSGAIVNLNTSGGYADPGPQGLVGPTEFDVSALGNLFNGSLVGGAEEVVHHDLDDAALGFVELSSLSGLVVSLDTLPEVLLSEEIDEGGSVTLTGEFTNVAQEHVVTITWGDGSPDTVIPLAAGAFTFSASSPVGAYADDPDGPTELATFGITVTIDEVVGGDSASDNSLSVGVRNVAPTAPLADADGDNQVDEGGTFNLLLGPVVDPGADTVSAYQIDWGDGSPLEFVPGDSLTTASTRSHTYTDGAAHPARTILVDLLDEDGTWIAAGTLEISVTNVAPTATSFLPFNSTVAEGGSTTVFFSEPFFDPGVADGPFHFAYDFNGNGVYGDPGEVGDGTYAGSSSVSFASVPREFLADDDDGPRTVNALIIDKDGGATEYSLQVAITNEAPVVDAGPDDSAVAGAPVDHLVTFTDPGADGDWTVSVDWDGVAGFEETFAVPTRTFNLADFSSQVFAAGDIGATFTVTVQVDDNNGGVHSDSFELTVAEDTLRVVDFVVDPSGLSVRFNRAIDLSVINLYNGFFDTTVDAPDLTLVGDTVGAVRGTLDWDSATNTLEFIKTGGVLAADTYTLTLVSGAHTPAVGGSVGFKDAAGADLDGDGDTVAGDDFVETFVVAAPPRSVGLPDFARGPGQVVDLSPTTTGQGTLELPVVLSDANGVFSVDYDLVYDPTVLSIEAPNNNVPLGPTMPSGWNSVGNHIAPGVLRISVTGTNPLSGANLAINDLAATVLPSALYGDTHVIRIENLSINEGAIASVADQAVHKVVFVGDASGSANYTGFDASLISRVLINVDTGFEAYDDTDPLIIADITQDGTISGFDSSLVNREALNRDNDPGEILEIPPVPAGVFTPSPGLIDPQLSIPTGLLGNGSSVSVPVNIDIAPIEVGGVIAATFSVVFDPALLAFDEAALGAATPSGDGWSIDANEINPGEVVVSLYGTAPALPEGFSQLSLLRFDVLASAEAPSVLQIDPVDPGDAGLLWTSVDGSVDLSRLPGDYNADGRVDAADYALWRDLNGTSVTPFTSADGDGDGLINEQDRQVWRDNYGAVLPPPLPAAAFALAVAEPGSEEASPDRTMPSAAGWTFLSSDALTVSPKTAAPSTHSTDGVGERDVVSIAQQRMALESAITSWTANSPWDSDQHSRRDAEEGQESDSVAQEMGLDLAFARWKTVPSRAQ